MYMYIYKNICICLSSNTIERQKYYQVFNPLRKQYMDSYWVVCE